MEAKRNAVWQHCPMVDGVAKLHDAYILIFSFLPKNNSGPGSSFKGKVSRKLNVFNLVIPLRKL
jgi:hypothetical protein